MSKTLPEILADILVEAIWSKMKKEGMSNTGDEGQITMIYGAVPGVVYRALVVKVDGKSISSAIDIPKQYYRPYRDYELDACVKQNLVRLVSEENPLFITAEDAQAFLSELDEIIEEDEA